nr:ribonuclease H-like domain-containing protein [Tanacetum cinerariifolium]
MTTDTTSGEVGTKLGRTVTLTAEDMQKKKNDVKARTTLLLSLSEKNQLQFSKYKTTRELWATILKTLGGNEATKKTKKNLLKQQYGYFKAEDSETLEQTFTRLQVIVGQLQFMDVEIEQDDLNQNGSQIKFEDINQIDENNIEEMDIKWNMVLLSMRADKFWKKTGKKISIQGSDMAGFDKSKVECFNYHKMGHFARECRAPRNQDRGRRDNYRQGSKAEEQDPKALITIDRKLETLKEEKEEVDGKLACLLKASKDLDNLIESQRSDKIKDGLGYKTGLPECANDTVTNYSRPLPTVESTPGDDQNRNPSVSEPIASPITSKPFIKFMKPKDSQSKCKSSKTKSPKKRPVKYAEQYRKPNKKPNVRGNQRNWNNLKTHQLGPDFVMKKKACFNYGDFNHLASDYRKRKISPGSKNFPTANRKFLTASRKFPTGSTKSSTADMGIKGKAAVPRTILMKKAIGIVAALGT